MNTPMTHALDADTARRWISSWDAQQGTFFSDREERFAVVIDVLEHVLDRSDPLIVDLGCGPGSLSRRIHERIPDARIVGVDMDPLLLELARAAHGDWLTVHQIDLRSADWLELLGLERAPDAVVSSTALHWLDREPLEAVLSAAAAALATGGVIVDADQIAAGDEAGMAELEEEIARRTVARGHHVPGAHDWGQWWDAVVADPDLAPLVTEREGVDLTHDVKDHAALPSYLAALRRGGCTSAGTVWQVGDDRVVVGLR